MDKDIKKFLSITRETIPTQIIALDIVLGGGFERGDLLEISSHSGIGKSTLLLTIATNLVSPTFRVCFMDVERGVKDSMLENMKLFDHVGGQFLHLCPITFEDAEVILKKVMDKDDPDNFCDLIIIDSITALLPSRLQDKSIAEMEVGLESRLIAALLKKVKTQLRETGATMWLINQMRTKIDFSNRFQSSTVDSAGGYALQFYPDIRIRLTAGAKMKRNEKTPLGIKEHVYGNEAKIVTIKNRANRSNIMMIIPIIYGRGVSNLLTLKMILTANGHIDGGRGGNYQINLGETEPDKVKGEEKLMTYIRENKDKILVFLTEQGCLNLTTENK